MISVEIVDQGTIDTTLPSTSDAGYQAAALCLFLRQQFAALRTAGIQFSRVEVSDFSTFRTDLSTYLDNAYDRETEIINNGVSTIVANLPDVLAIGAAFASGGATEAGACILNIVLGKLLGGDSGARGDYRGAENSVDLTEVTEKLQEIADNVLTILTEQTINIHTDTEDVTFRNSPYPES